MLKLLILLSVVVYALGAAVPQGMIPQLDGRIVGGEPTTISNYPWQVSIQKSGAHNCGGSIYSSNVIITAAHCLQYVTSSILKVRAGSTYWDEGGSLINVAKFKFNFDYNYYTFEYDIGLIKLESSLIMSATTKPIALATRSPAHGAAAVVTGWGTTSYGSSVLPTTLQAVDVSIVSEAVCASNAYGYTYKEVMHTMICAYAVGKDACQGDSGGPLVSGGLLVGVVSWGFGCANPYYPGVYADIASVHKWIETNAETI